MTSQLDTSVFRDPVTPEEMAAHPLTGIAALGQMSKPALAGIAAAGLAVWLVCSMGVANAAADSYGPEVSAVNVGSGIFLAGVLLAAVGFLLEGRKEDPRIAAARLSRFVERNGLFYNEDPTLPRLGGLIFEEGHHRKSWQRFRNGPASTVPFEVAQYSYQTGTGDRDPNTRPSVTKWTYAAVGADRRLPRMLLDAKDNDRWYGSSVPASIAKSQRVPLEGDLNDHFTLYAPEGHEEEARAVFTPEVLRRMLADAPGFDVETIDDQILFFTRKQLDLTTEEAWDRLSRLIYGAGAAILGMANRQISSERFASGAKPMPAGGRTLKRSAITPVLLWTVAGLAVLVLARVLLTGPLNGMI